MQNFKPYGNPFWLRLKPKWVFGIPLFLRSCFVCCLQQY